MSSPISSPVSLAEDEAPQDISGSTLPNFTKENTLYFFDGNIVIAAAIGNEEGLIFRVHKSLLSLHSPVFSDMFSIPASPDGALNPNDFFEGVPLVRMYDKAADVFDFLRIFYHAPSFMLTRYDPETPRKIQGILRLAKKYQITFLSDRLIKQFEADWPQTIPEWDRLEGEVMLCQTRRRTEDLEEHIPPFNDDIFPEPGSAIRLAREFHLTNVLPAAFYHLSRLEISCDRSAKEIDRGVAARIVEVQEEGGRTADWSFLTNGDLKCLLLGRERIRQYLQGKATLSVFHVSLKEVNMCHRDCNAASLDSKLQSLARCTSDAMNDLKALVAEDGEAIEELCPTCQRRAGEIATGLRMAIWDSLYEFFNLPIPSYLE
ncbi:hypothetical protein CONPUDRAFT_73485 [Coniophora puteana RWD-64-598 SS2]|uniref:BTB domain-containing protein n=1 Tax=Coniophora puteana (strain RWD-64-598) TaxID=741705 RepID=A0A5M3MMD9_CONPW|nr:uncharacterized protein CONPUDRAFT_73485 [Coniophora puteana RWD-64-598 SS2]EIW80338.1 hypothetical protein CONPUDRAFT_73485 [Coniophora puteana RWD-64-598 SS2]